MFRSLPVIRQVLLNTRSMSRQDPNREICWEELRKYMDCNPHLASFVEDQLGTQDI